MLRRDSDCFSSRRSNIPLMVDFKCDPCETVMNSFMGVNDLKSWIDLFYQ